VTDIDSITVSVPSERRFLGVVNLVLGGLCTRLDLPFERVDDLQLAVDSVLAGGRPTGAEVVLEAVAEEDLLRVTLGPLAPGTGAEPGLQRVLAPLVGATEAIERDGAEWLSIEVARSTAGAKAE
jgi:hypothetical protein